MPKHQKEGGILPLLAIPAITSAVFSNKRHKQRVKEHRDNVNNARQMYSGVLPASSPDIDFLNLHSYSTQAKDILHHNTLKEKAMSFAEENFGKQQ
jgi:hypothetical protein